MLKANNEDLQKNMAQLSSKLQLKQQVVLENEQKVFHMNLQIEQLKEKAESLNLRLKSEMLRTQKLESKIMEVDSENRVMREFRVKDRRQVANLRAEVEALQVAKYEKKHEAALLSQEVVRHERKATDLVKALKEEKEIKTNVLQRENNILKERLDELDIQLTEAVISNRTNTQKLIGLIMKNGTEMMKHCRVNGSRNKTHRVRVWIDDSETHICWDSSGIGTKLRQLPISSTVQLMVGHTSTVNKSEWPNSMKRLSFNIKTTSRILALIAPNKPMYDVWITGMRQLFSKICGEGKVKVVAANDGADFEVEVKSMLTKVPTQVGGVNRSRITVNRPIASQLISKRGLFEPSHQSTASRISQQL